MEIFFTFSSTHTVILAEKALIDAKIKAKVRPLPSVIKAGCGLCLCVELADLQQANTVLGKAKASADSAYLHKNGGFTLI